jgi:O-acetyl-ADP-ribose deacetylase
LDAQAGSATIKLLLEAFMPQRISLVRGDITRQDVDAIVNAANQSLLGGGGVDGAIHRAAGPGLLEECRSLNGCVTGEAKITRGYRLTARFVIHTVGPVWYGGQQGEDQLLANCYRSSLRLATDKGLQSVAFPAISTGVYRFPSNRAAAIALRELREFMKCNSLPSDVRIVCFDEATHKAYVSAGALAEDGDFSKR